MDPQTLAVGGRQAQYFRNGAFSKVMLACVDMLKDVLGAPDNTRMIFLTASGSAAMEAAVINLFTPQDKVLVISGGTFGTRFKRICDIHHVPVETIDLAWNEAFNPEALSGFEHKGITGMLVNMCETSTGQLYPMEIITEFCKRNNICLVVDAISSFLCDSVRMKELGAGAVIISSQKGLALHPGMSFVAVSEEAFESRCRKNEPETLYFRFTNCYREMLRGQTEFTPAVSIINQLEEKLGRLLMEGVWRQVHHIALLASYFREQLLEKTRFTYPHYPLSNCITPVLCPKNNAEEIVAFLRDTHDIYVTPAAGELAASMFRVAHMSRQLTKDDIDVLIGLLRPLAEAPQ
jgi:aspartate aminotransferase-like enzyme